MNNWKFYLSAGALALGLSQSVAAQGEYYGSNNNYDNRNNYVTVYEHCDFRGASRSLAVGDYENMRKIDFGNDKMSSIRVPQGTEVSIYEDDNYRGAYARITRDIACFDRSWNDKVSSMRIKSNGYNNQPRNSEYDNRYSRDDRRYDNNRNSSPRTNLGVTAKNLAMVAFGNSVLQQTGNKQWEMRNPRSRPLQFKETSRDANSVYLQNDYTAEKVRIDLFANDVTLITRDGRRDRFVINGKQATLANTPVSRSPAIPGNQNRAIRGKCFNYRAYTTGGDGGLRFHGKEGFFRFSKKAKTGRICHNGSLTMEINKTSPNTEVIVEINDNRYRFAKNEEHDKYKNNWYRKMVKLRVGG